MNSVNNRKVSLIDSARIVVTKVSGMVEDGLMLGMEVTILNFDIIEISFISTSGKFLVLAHVHKNKARPEIFIFNFVPK